jgi:hypothetical protein
MTAALNGHSVTATPEPEPAYVVARGLYESQFSDGDTPWTDLPAADVEDMVAYCRIAIGLHLEFLDRKGFRVVPPATLLKPTTEEEAMGMVRLAKNFLDGLKRKGKLMGGVTPGKLILPPGVH